MALATPRNLDTEGHPGRSSSCREYWADRSASPARSLIVEVAASSASIDLRDKRRVHHRQINLRGNATKAYFFPMTVIEAPKPVANSPQIWPLGVKAYHALGDLGLIPEKTELLYGQIFHKMSKSPLHSFLSEFLEDILRGAVPAGCHVRGEEPLTIGDSEPEPDLVVVRGRREDYRQAHPTTAELVIEVCVSSHD